MPTSTSSCFEQPSSPSAWPALDRRLDAATLTGRREYSDDAPKKPVAVARRSLVSRDRMTADRKVWPALDRIPDCYSRRPLRKNDDAPNETHLKSLHCIDELPDGRALRNPVLVAHCLVQRVAGRAVTRLRNPSRGAFATTIFRDCSRCPGRILRRSNASQVIKLGSVYLLELTHLGACLQLSRTQIFESRAFSLSGCPLDGV
jgi:hypothetical protein